ncbi:hypothetical protein, partial [Spirosoma areae]
HTNTDLLKEYIKTLHATEVVFPRILPRQWGNEFRQTELQAIYFGLKFVLKGANRKTQKGLIEEFTKVEEPDIQLHWFLRDHWKEVVALMTKKSNQVQ